jgi:hypothetical protein
MVKLIWFQRRKFDKCNFRKLSPSTFDSGKLSFAQNTTNFDVSKKFDKLNVAEQNFVMKII